MTSETRQQPSEEQIAIALAHLSMISQAANGEYRPRPGEIETRQTWLTSFIRNGQGIVTDEDRRTARLINLTLGTQSEKLSTQPHSLSTQSDAA